MCWDRVLKDACVRLLTAQDGEPQAIDALASCYDDTSRPPLLSYKHIQAHLSRAAAGQGQVPDTQSLDSSMPGQQQHAAADRTYGSNSSSGGSSGLSSGPQRDLAFSSGSAGANSSALLQFGSIGSSGGGYGSDPLGSASLTQQQQQQLAGSDSWQVLFDGLEAVQPAVTVSQTLLDFGCCSRLSPAEPQSFQVSTQRTTLANGTAIAVLEHRHARQNQGGPHRTAVHASNYIPSSSHGYNYCLVCRTGDTNAALACWMCTCR